MGGSQLEVEQSELIDTVSKIKDKIKREYEGKGFSWNRLRGDATNRVVGEFLQRHLLHGTKVVRYAWIEGCEYEFDILLVDAEATPLPFTNIYPKRQVHAAIEVKSAGVFHKKSEVKVRLIEWKNRIETRTGKTVLYLSLWERRSYFDLTISAIGNSDTFVLQVENEVKDGEWSRFLERVKQLLSADS